MRLIMPSLLCCARRGCDSSAPLTLRVAAEEGATSLEPQEFRADCVRAILGKVDWDVVQPAATQLGLSLPPQYEQQDLHDDVFLRAVHEALFEFHVLRGELVCANCERSYPIVKGIPNMKLAAEELRQ
eukprot:Polyplicarium_translucidae@DN4489_c0_g1_i1.p1